MIGKLVIGIMILGLIGILISSLLIVEKVFLSIFTLAGIVLIADDIWNKYDGPPDINS